MTQKETFLGSLTLAPAQAQKALGSLVPVEKDAAVTLLFVPAGQTWEGKIIELDTPYTHFLIMSGAGAYVTVTVRVSGKGTRRHATEIMVGDGAVCSVTEMQECEDDARLTVREEAHIGKDAMLSWHTRALGAGDIDHELRSRVAGEGSRSDVLWTCMASEKQRRSIRAENMFEASRGSGEMTLKGIAQDHASVRVLGKIIIGEQGGGTDTYLTQEVLMLDPTAKVDAVPALEIKTNDVKASHSASIRRITPDDLFYFGARGITEEKARDMFIRGFLGVAQEDASGIE